MLNYILRRLLAMIPLLVVITSFIFVIGQYGSGDLAAYLTEHENGGRFDPVVYQSFRQRLHLDQPVYVRYGEWVVQALHGDLGVSYVSQGEPSISYMIGQALPISLEIGAAALVLVIIVGIPLGMLAAIFRNTPLDYGIVGVVTVLSSVPLFVLAPLAVYFFVIQNSPGALGGSWMAWHLRFGKYSACHDSRGEFRLDHRAFHTCVRLRGPLTRICACSVCERDSPGGMLW